MCTATYAGYMTTPRALIAVFAALTLSACGSSANTASVTQAATPSAAATTVDTSVVTDDNSGVDCTELGQSGYPFITQQAALKIDDQEFQIATVACSTDTGEASAEVVESFIQDAGVWASNGIASGPDVAFRTTGECSTDGSQVQCPANISSEDGSEVSGMVVVTGENGQPVWNFVPAS